DDEVGQAIGVETGCENVADAAVTDDDRMVGKRGDRQFLRLFLLDRRGREYRAVNDLQPLFHVGDGGEIKRVDEDGNDGAGKDQIAALLRQQFQREADAGKNKGKFADLPEAGADRQGGGYWMLE